MLFAKLRNKRISLYSTLIIVFAILAKMLMPIAHASNSSSNGQKSFLASLCSGNKVVFIELSLPGENKPKPTTAIVSNKCPLCSLVEQDTTSNDIAPAALSFQASSNLFTQVNDKLLNSHLISFGAIRAPPLLS